jgi:hypothetical protein
MRKFFVLTLLLGIVAIAGMVAIPVALSTSGGLDRRGGHHCWTRCASQGLYRGQYHCHRSPCNRVDIRTHRRHGH